MFKVQRKGGETTDERPFGGCFFFFFLFCEMCVIGGAYHYSLFFLFFFKEKYLFTLTLFQKSPSDM